MRNGRMAAPSTQMTVEEVMAEAGVGRNTAYRIIRRLNVELEFMGKNTFRGRVNRRFFEEKIGYGTSREIFAHRLLGATFPPAEVGGHLLPRYNAIVQILL